jgi:SAM-dependent methyltransferase
VKTVLNIGSSGHHILGDRYPAGEWEEIRVDLDEDVNPDIKADARDIPLPDGCADAVFSSHVLEHLPETDLPRTLGEWRRLLKPDGELVINVPNLQMAAEQIAAGRGWHTLYETPDGTPIRAIDMVYGFYGAIAAAPLWSHLTGFTADTLAWWLGQLGFVGEVHTVEAGTSLEARARKNGQPKLPDQPTILLKGTSMETQPQEQPQEQPAEDQPAPEEPQEQPQPAEEPQQTPQEQMGVSDAAEAQVVDPDE